MANGNTKPIKKYQAGGISAAIWKNNVETKGNAVTVLSVTLDRRYKDGEGNWQSSSSMRLNDLPKAVLVLTQAYTYMATAHEDEEQSEEGGAE